MKKLTSYRTILFLLVILVFVSCRKNDTKKIPEDLLKGDCHIQLLGVQDKFFATDSLAHFNFIDESTGLLKTYHSYDSIYFNAFEYEGIITDSCYCILGKDSVTNGDYANVIQSINIYNGNRIIIKPPFRMRGLCYNNITKSFYTVKNDSALITFKINSGAMTGVTILGATNLYRQYTSSVSISNTGKVYIVSTGGTLFVYDGTGITTIAIASHSHLSGLKYNQNDGYLYGVYNFTDSKSYTLDSIVKINPVDGTITTLSKLPYHFNEDFYSTVMDQCNNVFVISTLGSLSGTAVTSNFTLYNCSTNKSVFISNPSSPYKGLAIKY